MVSGAVVDRSAFAGLWACLISLTVLTVPALTLSAMRHPDDQCFGGSVWTAVDAPSLHQIRSVFKSVHQRLVLFVCSNDLISNLFGVYRHATSRCHSKRLKLIRCMDELLFTPDLTFRPPVPEEPLK